MFIRRKRHDAIVREMGRMIVKRDDTIMIREATIGRLERQLTAARAEAEANKVDATLWRKARERRKQGRAAA